MYTVYYIYTRKPFNAAAHGLRNFGRVRGVLHNGKQRKAVAPLVALEALAALEEFACTYIQGISLFWATQ